MPSKVRRYILEPPAKFAYNFVSEHVLSPDSKARRYIIEPPAKFAYNFVSEHVLSPDSKVRRYIIGPPAKFASRFVSKKVRSHDAELKNVSDRVLSSGAKVGEKLIPDKLLLLFINALDKRASPETIDAIVDQIDKHVSENVRASLLAIADEYVPDTAANSRKVSSVIAGICKYIPDRMIPVGSAEKWSNLKAKFSIPTLLRRDGKSAHSED